MAMMLIIAMQTMRFSPNSAVKKMAYLKQLEFFHSQPQDGNLRGVTSKKYVLISLA